MLFDQSKLEKLYESVILGEMRDQYIDEVEADRSPNQLPFNDIFSGQIRMLLSFGDSEIFNDMVQDLKQIKNYSHFDPKDGTVVKKIKIPEEHGGGEKETKMSLGKAIHMIGIPEEKKKKYLDFFATYKDELENLSEKGSYVIILSRSPIDILRMSDHRSWSSCHSQDGSEFGSAIGEGLDGGAVAYVIPSPEYKKFVLDGGDLQSEEVFADRERSVSGMVPVARLRIFRFYDESDKTNLAIPDDSTYGRHIPDFFQTVRKFFFEKQNLDFDDIYQKFSNGEIVRYGGRYEDTNDISKFNDFFQTKEFSKLRNLEYKGKTVDKRAEMEEEIDNILDGYSFTNMKVSGEVYDSDGEPYFSGYATAEFSLKGLVLNENEDDFDLDDYEAYRRLARGQIPWRYVPNGEQKVATPAEARIMKFFSNLDSDINDNIYGVKITSNSVVISMEPSNDYNYDTAYFDSFCFDMSKIDKSFSDWNNRVLKALILSGYADAEEYSKYKRYFSDDDDDEDPIEFEHFTYDEDTGDFYTSYLELFKADDETNDKVVPILTGQLSLLTRYVEKVFFKLYTQMHPKQPKREQLSFQSFFESNNGGEFYGKPPFKLNLQFGGGMNYSEVTCRIGLGFEKMTNDIFDITQWFDEMFPHILNIIRFIIAKRANIDNDWVQKMEPLYKKYL